MSIMTTVPFSMRIDPEIKSELEHEARISNRSASYIATQAIINHLQAKKEKNEAIRRAVELANKGEFVSEEAADSWVDSWSLGEEKPIPEPDVFLSRK